MEQNRDCDPVPAETRSRGGIVLPMEAQGRIASQLRDAYGALLVEPLPDRLTRLLEDLAESEESG
jgi:hypothetical protein